MPAGVHEKPGLAALRALVAEKFPQATCAPAARLRTGCEPLDRHGGLIRGVLTEVCGSLAGGQIVLSALLAASVREGFFLSLIDAADTFEPADWPGPQLNRLLWVRSRAVVPALKAADILIRDGNLPVLLLDLQAASPRQLQRVPATTWHRFHRVIASSATVFLVLTPRPMVEAAPCRIAVRLASAWDAMSQPRPALIENLDTRIFERGREETTTTLATLRQIAG